MCVKKKSGTFAWLGSHSSLATRKDATVEVVLATCHKRSSKVCLLFGPFGPTSLQQKAAAQALQLWDSNELHCRIFLNGDCAAQKRDAAQL